jgi:hypothetical protein
MSTENQYHDQAPGCFSLIRGNRNERTLTVLKIAIEASPSTTSG